MKVALYTLTRDRLDYTKICFAALQEKAGYPYDHYVIDNGSIDGTVEWLLENDHLFEQVIYNIDNKGISIGGNQAFDIINHSGIDYDLIVKLDNDGILLTDNTLKTIVDIYKNGNPVFTEKLVLAPRVVGINNQPKRSHTINILGHKIGLVTHVGGMFMAKPRSLFKTFRYDESLPMASLNDDKLLFQWKVMTGGEIGYVEELEIEHYETTDGQARRYPDYFKRKRIEEKEPYV